MDFSVQIRYMHSDLILNILKKEQLPQLTLLLPDTKAEWEVTVSVRMDEERTHLLAPDLVALSFDNFRT